MGRRTIHGNATRNGRTKEYVAFYNAMKRCRDPRAKSFKWYGARGVEFRFTSFAQFIAEIGPCPSGMTLDRRDSYGHYEPGNIKWSTHKEQQNNRRNNHAAKPYADILAEAMEVLSASFGANKSSGGQ